MKILVYPKDNNPYQNLLFSKLPASDDSAYLSHISSNNFLSLLYLPIQVLFYRLCGYKVFHLHWIYTFRFRTENKFFQLYPFKLFMTVFLMLFLLELKALRYKLVWTVHDVLPHGDYFVNNKFVSRILAQICDKKIIHTKQALTDMGRNGLDTRKTEVIPIGNYVDIYPNSVSKSEARKKLIIPANAFVYGMFGKIEKYKGAEELMKTFLEMNDKNIFLVFAGTCPDQSLKKRLKELAAKATNIQLNFNFVKDENVQLYLNAFDILVYPFKNITTSSSVILAMSFKRTVICPAVADIKDYPSKTGYYYSDTDKNSLRNVMRSVLQKRDEIARKNLAAFEFIGRYSWKNSAESTSALFRTL